MMDASSRRSGDTAIGADGGNSQGAGKEEALVREIRENLHSVKWLPADDVILNDIEKLL